MPLTIRPETPADVAAIREVNVLAFAGDNEARLIEAIRAAPEFTPELSLVAVDGQQMVGHILFSPICIRGAAPPVAALALAPMAVRPGLQRAGIGSALVRHGLEACRRFGHRIVVVLGHAHYYPRFGFTPARGHGVEPPWPVADEVFMLLELVPGALNGVRGIVEYPAAFAMAPPRSA